MHKFKSSDFKFALFWNSEIFLSLLENLSHLVTSSICQQLFPKYDGYRTANVEMYHPLSHHFKSGDVNGRSVPSLRNTLNCSGRRISFHSASVFSTFVASKGVTARTRMGTAICWVDVGNWKAQDIEMLPISSPKTRSIVDSNNGADAESEWRIWTGRWDERMKMCDVHQFCFTCWGDRSYNISCQRIVWNYLQGHSTENPFLSNVFKLSAIFRAKIIFSFMFHSLNTPLSQTQLPRTPSHTTKIYTAMKFHIKSSRK